MLQAQVGLGSGEGRIALIAQVAPRASMSETAFARATRHLGNVTEQTVTIRLSANTGYRLMVVGTASESVQSGTVSGLWVKTESGRFEKITSGAAVTVIRGQAVSEWEPQVTFRTEQAESMNALPVRYEVRIDPTI
jgi:hypothetical protein